MARGGRSEVDKLRDACENAREWFYVIHEAKKQAKEWAKDYKVDSIIFFVDQGQIEKARQIIKHNERQL